MNELTAAACRAARALLRWGVRDLGEASGVSYASISQFENGRAMRSANRARLAAALEREGVEILPDGARLRLLTQAANGR